MRLPSRRRWLGLGLALGCAPPWAADTAPPRVVVVEIRDYKYLPARLRIQVGTTVRWVNAERRTTHTVRFAGADGMESERLFPGESFERRFDKPGAYAYICGPHPEMTGHVDVTP
jgi:plastocyanin